MSLEAATYISELVSTNPLGTDPKAQGDDHLRLLKAVLQATFVGFSRAFYAPTTVAAKTSAYSVLAADQNKLIPVTCSTANITITLPAGSGLPDGYEIEIIKTDHTDYLVVIDGSGSETVNGALTQNLWQSYQTAKLRYSTALSAWLLKREYIPPKGEITPWGGASAVPDGWLYPNGTAIGNASSAAAQRANADCEGLFYHLWNNYANDVCAVSSGRGASAAADWAANKTIGTPNLAGRTWVGLDNLGGISDAGVLTATANGANTAGQTNGEAIGSESNTLAIAQLPSHDHSFSATTSSDGSHTHTTTAGELAAYGAGAVIGTRLNQAAGAAANVQTTGAHTHTLSGTSGAAGSGTAHANVQPSFVSAWKIKI